MVDTQAPDTDQQPAAGWAQMREWSLSELRRVCSRYTGTFKSLPADREKLLRIIAVERQLRKAAEAQGVSERQFNMMRHALGHTGYRNYYACSIASANNEAWLQLVDAGFAASNKMSLQPRYPCYRVTEAGQELVGVLEVP